MLSPTLISIFPFIIVVMVALVVILISVVRTLQGGNDVVERVQQFAYVQTTETRGGGDQRRVRLLRVRMRVNSMLSSLSSEGLRLQLLRANWPITETEYTLIRLGIASFGLALGSLFSGSILPGIGLAIIAFFMPVMFLRRRINQRQLAFARQLVDTLLLINGGIRAGYSLLQSLDIVIDEMKAPTSEEFYRVRREVGLGLPLTRALENLGVRMENDDLNLVIAAININTQVGGSLSTMLQAVTNTIRERIRLFSEVRALTAQNRNSGTILTFLPIVVGGVLFVLNPSYMARLFEPGWILCIPAGALFGILLGNIIIRRMVKIDL